MTNSSLNALVPEYAGLWLYKKRQENESFIKQIRILGICALEILEAH